MIKKNVKLFFRIKNAKINKIIYNLFHKKINKNKNIWLSLKDLKVVEN